MSLVPTPINFCDGNGISFARIKSRRRIRVLARKVSNLAKAPRVQCYNITNNMATPKKYFHDHLVMLLLSVDIFLAIGGSLFILLSLGSSNSSSYIVQCRDCSNTAAVNKFTNGSMSGLLAFIVFAALVVASQLVLSYRAYKIHRQLAITILALGVPLLVIMIIVSNALLMLR